MFYYAFFFIVQVYLTPFLSPMLWFLILEFLKN